MAAVRGCPCPVAGRSLRRPIRLDGSVPAALRSLDADCAPASCLRWSATPALRARAAPHGYVVPNSVRPGGPGCHQPTEVGQAKMAGCHVSRVYGSGLPMPRRRTFAPASCLRSLDADCASASCLRWSATPALEARAAPHGCIGLHTSPRRKPGDTGLRRRIPSLTLRACMNAPIQAPGGSRGTPAGTVTPRTMRMRPDINLHGKRYPLLSRSPPASAGGFLK